MTHRRNRVWRRERTDGGTSHTDREADSRGGGTVQGAARPVPVPPRRSRTGRCVVGLAVVVALAGSVELLARFLVEEPSALIRSPLDGNVNLGVPEFFESHTSRFWALRPDIDRPPCFWGDVTDRRGMRRRSGSSAADPCSDSGTVLCVGDSCTYGLGVTVDEAWPALLDARLPRPVLNAGVPGYSSYQGRLYLDEIRTVCHPAACVVQFGPNDANPWPSRQRDGVVCLTDRQRARFVSLRIRFETSRALSALFRAVDPVPEPIPRPFDDADWEHTTPRVPLDEFRAGLAGMAGAGIPTVLLAWPRRQLLDDAWAQRMPEERAHAYYEAVAAVPAPGGAVVELLPVFRGSGLPPHEIYLDDVHLTPAGHRLVADAVAEAIRRVLR